MQEGEKLDGDAAGGMSVLAQKDGMDEAEEDCRRGGKAELRDDRVYDAFSMRKSGMEGIACHAEEKTEGGKREHNEKKNVQRDAVRAQFGVRSGRLLLSRAQEEKQLRCGIDKGEHLH